MGWDCYLVELDDSPATILVDLDAVDDAPDAARPWRHEFGISYTDHDAYGFPTEAESGVLHAAEEQVLNDEALEPLGLRLVGAVTMDGTRTLVLYGRSEDDAGLLAGLAAALPGHSVAHEATEDPEWEFYLDELYPSPLEHAISVAHHILDDMEEQGDNLEVERDIDHWAGFAGEDARATFERAVEAEGFRVVQRETAKDEDLPYIVQISRRGAPTHEHIEELIYALSDLAEANGGEYGGWETTPSSAS